MSKFVQFTAYLEVEDETSLPDLHDELKNRMDDFCEYKGFPLPVVATRIAPEDDDD